MTAKDLKNALLQEAVQGKLVPQIASEGNAKDLLEEIRKEKAKLVKEGKLKKEKPLPEITEEDIPFDIPENWCWCRFGDIFQHNTGKTQNSSVETKNGTLRKFITTSNLYWNEFDFTKVKEMLFSENELQRCTVTKGDLLICEGGEYGRAAIWNYDYDVCFQNHVHRAREIKQNTLYIEFYYYLIFLYKNIGLIEGRGVGIKSLSTENLHQIIIPLPPLAEQKRIVAAIEKFMPLIDEYDKKETELKAFNEQIGLLTKKAILQEAVQGKLVPQIAAEGNAKDLLEEIRKERLSHGLDFANAKSGKKKSKKETALAGSNPCDISDDEIPFDIPESWCWCRLGEIFQHNTGKTQNSSVETKNGTLRKFITTSNLYWNEFDFSKVKEMLFSDSELERCTVTKGDLLVCEGGDYGRSAIWKYDYDVCFQNHIHRLRPFKKDTLSIEFYYYVLFLFKNKGVIQGKGVGIKSLSTETLHKVPIPLPPLAEQKRIVEAIEKMMPVCENLGK